MRKLTLVGSDHFNQDYGWIFRVVEEIAPDCITLEQKIDGAASLYWEFKKPLPEVIAKHKERRCLLGEYAAGVHYARQRSLPVYCIDEFTDFSNAVVTDMNSENNFELLRGSRHLFRERDSGKREDDYTNWTRRNHFMAFAINYHFLMNEFSNILHIGGSGHYDETKCVPLQRLVVADSIELIDGVMKMRRKYR